VEQGVVMIEQKETSSPPGGWRPSVIRERALAATLFLLTTLLLYAAFLITKPFISSLAWALSLAIVFYPFYIQVNERVKSSNIAALVCVSVVAFLVVGPVFIAVQQIAAQAASTVENVREGEVQRQIDQVVKSHHSIERIYNWANARFNTQETMSQAATAVGQKITNFLTGSVTGLFVLLVTFFFLFYFFRDGERGVEVLRTMLPLSDGEADRLLVRVRDTIRATVFGTLLVACVQGALGGLMFWWLGLAAPVLWGVVMGLLAVVPILGAFIIWIPAAIFLALSGAWIKAIILTLWGAVVIGLVDNLLYPVLVGRQLELHTVPVFISIVGGLLVFGGSGIILGPLVLALTHGLMDIWRQRARTGKIVRSGVHI
jgi:predicted PurR-regulated permease PerM